MKNNNYTPLISGYQQLKELRTALAILQGTKLLSTLQQEAEATVSHDQTKRVTYLTGLFSRIHREIFQDWKEQISVSHRPGTMLDAKKRQAFRKTISRLVLDDKGNSDTAIFDSNGFVIKTDNIAARLAAFYLKMRSVRPFAYGNRITLDFFLTMLGLLPAFKEVYEQGIDFRRLAADDTRALHEPKSSIREITRAFKHALDPNRSKSLQNKANGYGYWPENKKFVSGIPFLSHTTADGIICLVSVNGGLVPLASIKEELFIAGRHLADYPLSVTENIIGYLPGTEDLRAPEKTEIDGIPIYENGAAPLFCLDINMLTGMRTPSHIELMELLKDCAGEKTPIFALADNEPLKRKMLLAADDDKRLQRTVEIAYTRLGKMAEKLARIKQNIFAGKKPDEQPKLYMSMGGAGSGKSAVEEIVKAQCGNNFVVASLDEFRKESDLYRVLTAANHHSDDYVYVEPFANRLRDLVANHAKQNAINILYDGTGIPYHPRYAGIVKQFKAAGFHTQITAVDAFIVQPKSALNTDTDSPIIARVKDRYANTGRALPWVVTIDKHIRSPVSFLDALADPLLDKIALFANDGAPDQHYLVAESFNFSDQELRILQDHQKNGTLAAYQKTLINAHPDSILKYLAGNNSVKLPELIDRNSAFNETNVAYQVYFMEQGIRILLIYNTCRMVGFVEKRQLNPNASGEHGLLHKPKSLAFHVDPLNTDPSLTRLQGSDCR